MRRRATSPLRSGQGSENVAPPYIAQNIGAVASRRPFRVGRVVAWVARAFSLRYVAQSRGVSLHERISCDLYLVVVLQLFDPRISRNPL